jgi:hypothetical protein
MSLSLNGWQHGRATITVAGDVPVNTVIDLPITNFGGGLEEEIEFREIADELINLDITNPDIIDEQSHLGYKLNFTYHYDDWILGSDLYEKFLPLILARQNGWSINLNPRIDNGRNFEVNLVNKSLILQLRRGGAMAKYHKGAVFTFRTKHLVQDLQWYLMSDPTEPYTVAVQLTNIVSL